MTFKRLDVPRAAAPLAYLALALLIYFDALLTYIAVGHLGAYEVVLTFVNQTPSAIWLVAAAKNAGVLYLLLKRRRHPWLDYAALALLLWHAAVVYNGIAQLAVAVLEPYTSLLNRWTKGEVEKRLNNGT